MRHKYYSDALVLTRVPHGEASATVFLLTPDFGLVKARAQGLRKAGAKLAPALQTLCQSQVSLVRGKEAWRISGATLAHAWAKELTPQMRTRVGRLTQLLTRLLRGESHEDVVYTVMVGLVKALPTITDEEQDSAECLAALRILRSLGLDAGEIPGTDGVYDSDVLKEVSEKRRAYIERVNRGINASGL